MKIFDFINHASIKCEFGGLTVITDPWYISNAFGSWYQKPSPLYSDIFSLIDSDEKMGVVTSHGHDDHIDDWFIERHLKDKSFFCPKFATPGLENRLAKKLGVHTTVIDGVTQFGDFEIQQFINPDFTEYDAVVSIKTSEFIIIHANDNYHSWPQKMKSELNEVCKNYHSDDIYLLIQFGVADCFPVNYLNTSSEKCYSIIQNRFEGYLSATEDNLSALGLNKMYYYANQSSFNYKVNNLDGHSMYELAQEFLKEKKSPHTQLLPGMSVHAKHKIHIKEKRSNNIFNYCLSAFENFINDSYQLHTSDVNALKVRFKVTGDKEAADNINYIADREVWNRIFTGELTLEAIIIGGAGTISKPVDNMSEHFFFVMKRGYIAQNKIRISGLSFFREHSHEA